MDRVPAFIGGLPVKTVLSFVGRNGVASGILGNFEGCFAGFLDLGKTERVLTFIGAAHGLTVLSFVRGNGLTLRDFGKL